MVRPETTRAQAADRRPIGIDWRLIVGLGLVLLYVLPLFVPPPARAVASPSADASLIARLFPQVPAWWVVGRLIALFVGATLIASVVRPPDSGVAARVVHPHGRGWKSPWVPKVALLAAALQVACVPWLAVLPPIGQTLFMVWFAVPAGLLAWGSARVESTPEPSGPRTQSASYWYWVGAVIVLWIVARLVVSWHSPRAADVVDMWRTFGGLARFAAAKANFLTEPMDPDLPGINSTPLFFQGLPLLQWLGYAPSLTWVQGANTVWLAVSAALLARLAALLAGPSAAVVAVAAFLFSPFVLLDQLSPIMFFVGPVSAAALGLLAVQFARTRSAATLVFFAGVAGITATYPAVAAISALAIVVVVWRCRRRPRLVRIVLITALLSFAAGLGQGLPRPAAIGAMLKLYVAPHWPWVVAENALQGQMSPTIADWTETNPPGWPVIPVGMLLSPFAISRNALRLWGDALLEPWSAVLAAIGLLVCVRQAPRNRVALGLLLFLVAAMLPGFLSSYDRISEARVIGAPIPLAMLSAVGFSSIRNAIASDAVRRWATAGMVIAIAAGGMLIFDVVNPRILSASAIGLLVRSVDEGGLDRAALLTAVGFGPDDVELRRRIIELDWLRKNHPYIDDIVRTVPKRPVPILPVQRAGQLADKYDLFFWAPALESTASVRDRVCNIWPDAALYTIVDTAGLSRLYGARPKGPGWKAALPESQWTVGLCREVARSDDGDDDAGMRELARTFDRSQDPKSRAAAMCSIAQAVAKKHTLGKVELPLVVESLNDSDSAVAKCAREALRDGGRLRADLGGRH